MKKILALLIILASFISCSCANASDSLFSHKRVGSASQVQTRCGKLDFSDYGDFSTFVLVNPAQPFDTIFLGYGNDDILLKNIKSSRIQVGDNVCVEGYFDDCGPDGLQLNTNKIVSIFNEDQTKSQHKKMIGPNIAGFYLGQTKNDFLKLLEKYNYTYEKSNSWQGHELFSAYIRNLDPEFKRISENIFAKFENNILIKIVFDGIALKKFFPNQVENNFLQFLVNAYHVPGLHTTSEDVKSYGSIIEGIRIWTDMDEDDGWTLKCKESGQAYQSYNISDWTIVEISLEIK